MSFSMEMGVSEERIKLFSPPAHDGDMKRESFVCAPLMKLGLAFYPQVLPILLCLMFLL
jgi:hypothetical protein